jgi:hypothetical protein
LPRAIERARTAVAVDQHVARSNCRAIVAVFTTGGLGTALCPVLSPLPIGRRLVLRLKDGAPSHCPCCRSRRPLAAPFGARPTPLPELVGTWLRRARTHDQLVRWQSSSTASSSTARMIWCARIGATLTSSAANIPAKLQSTFEYDSNLQERQWGWRKPQSTFEYDSGGGGSHNQPSSTTVGVAETAINLQERQWGWRKPQSTFEYDSAGGGSRSVMMVTPTGPAGGVLCADAGGLSTTPIRSAHALCLDAVRPPPWEDLPHEHEQEAAARLGSNISRHGGPFPLSAWSAAGTECHPGRSKKPGSGRSGPRYSSGNVGVGRRRRNNRPVTAIEPRR